MKLSLVSGIFFAAALLTKDFAAFVLIPLFLFYVYSRPKNPMLILKQLASFAAPAIISSLLWYQLVLGKDLLYMFRSSDFNDVNYSGVKLSYSFVGTFLWTYGLGVFFIVTAVFSLLLIFQTRKEFPKTSNLDLICLATILPILLLDTYLGAGLNLKAPYNNAIKYVYPALPFFCLIAASAAGKCFSLFGSVKIKSKGYRNRVFLIVATAAILLGLTFLADLNSARWLAGSGYLIFRANLDQTVGYSLYNHTPAAANSLLMYTQYVGYAVLLSGLLWVARRLIYRFLAWSFRPMRTWIQEKLAYSHIG